MTALGVLAPLARAFVESWFVFSNAPRYRITGGDFDGFCASSP